MSTSFESRRGLDSQNQKADPLPEEILHIKEFREKGPVKTLSVRQITGNVMTDVKKNEWVRNGPARGGSDTRAFVNGHYAKRNHDGTLQYFPKVECPPLSNDIIFIEEGSKVEWAFEKKGDFQIFAELSDVA